MLTTKKNNLMRVAVMLLLTVLGSVGAWAEDGVVTVGNGGRGSSYLPCYPNNKYSMSQQIYTQDEIGKAGFITSIAFYNYEGGSARECDIYLSHTTKTSFDSATDWVTVSAGDKVYSGKMELKSGWTVIDFDTPFQYDGTKNLLLTVDDNTGEDTGSNFLIGASDVSSDQSLSYYKMFGTPVNLDPTQAITETGSVYNRKNHIKLCFETYPKPSRFEAAEIGNVSAQIQCMLRGEATAWNLRYRKVGTETWTVQNGLTERSMTIEDLTAATKYEAQVQAVFPEDHLSAWTESLTFTTACCPVEEQAEIIYVMNSNYSNYYGYALQFIDITDAANPVEVGYINPPDYGLYRGTLTLCCGHQYKVNWIYDAEHENVNSNFSLALYFEPGDLFYSMARGEAPEETAELTTFVMDCTPYCTQKPQNVSEASTTFNSATLSFVSKTTGGEVVYSTEADFDPDTATPTPMTFTALEAAEDPWGGVPDNASLTLTGLEPLTVYYVRVRSVCIDELTGEPAGMSRWSDPIRIVTGSLYDAPSQVKAEPINSRTEKLTWLGHGSEKGYSLYYRKQATGTAVDMTAIQTFGGGNGNGFEVGSWGKEIWSSYGDRPFSNTLYVANVPAGSSFSFMAGNGKTGGGLVKFLYGMKKKDSQLTPLEQMKKFDRKCLNDADRALTIKKLQEKISDLEAQFAELNQKLANGEITEEQYVQQLDAIGKEIDTVNAIIDELNTLPTDAQKLEQMKELEQSITQKEDVLAYAADKYAKGELTKEQYEKGKAEIETQIAQYRAELSELRAIITNAENPQKDGFLVVAPDDEYRFNNARRRAGDDDTYVFFIRHSDPNGVLLVKDLMITPPDQVNEWILIPNVTGTEYTLTGLEPSTTYEVMVEPIYEDGTTGTLSPITVFTTLGQETDPVNGDFSVSATKKVNFAHGNLRCEGERYEDEWSMAKQQYDILGQENIDAQESRSYPAWLIDLFCWSTNENYYGVSTFYYYDDEEAQSYFDGDFADWGECPALIRDLGPGWTTLNKAEWNYLLNERPNAAALKSHAKVNDVKGLVILPDEWVAPDGVVIGEEMTAEQWAVAEQAGAVFLPAAGQMTISYVDYNTTTTVAEAGAYWMGTPSDDASGMKAYVLSFNDTEVSLDTDLSRRVGLAVRLVKEAGTNDGPSAIKVVTQKVIADGQWYDLQGRKLNGMPTRKGVYLHNGRAVVVR